MQFFHNINNINFELLQFFTIIFFLFSWNNLKLSFQILLNFIKIFLQLFQNFIKLLQKFLPVDSKNLKNFSQNLCNIYSKLFWNLSESHQKLLFKKILVIFFRSQDSSKNFQKSSQILRDVFKILSYFLGDFPLIF